MAQINKSKDYLSEIVSDEFIEFYKSVIKPAVKPLENRRLANYKKIKYYNSLTTFLSFLILFDFITVFVIALISEITDNAILKDTTPVISLSIVVLVFMAVYFQKCQNKIVEPIISEMKYTVYNKLFSYFGNFKFYGKDFINPKEIENRIKLLKLIKDFNRFSCDDYIEGEYKGLKLSIADVNIQNEQKSGKSSYTTTILDGILLEADYNKEFKSTTIIKTDLGLFNNDKVKGLEKVKLEDPVFEKEFEVYSDDQIEARYLITTSFMERLLKLKKRLKCDIECSFEYGKLYAAIHRPNDWFDISIDKSLTDIKNFQKIMLDFAFVLQPLDALQADSNIGL